MEIDEDPSTYLQAETTQLPDEHGALWRLPVSPDSLKKPVAVGPLDDAPPGLMSYAKRCQMITKNWRTKQPAEWIPQELIPNTHYSLALLHALAKLSSRSKGLRQECHKQLLHCVQLRQPFHPPAEVKTVTGLLNCEPIIVERTNGLMIKDVVECLAHQDPHAAKAAKAERSLTETQNQQAKAVQRVTERRAAKQKQQIQMQQELWKGSADTPQLVDIEWHDTDQNMAGTADGTLTKKQLKKALRTARAKSRLEQEAVARVKIHQAMLATKGANKPPPRKERAKTMAQLAAELQDEDDDKSWDSDSDSDGGVSLVQRVMPKPDELEPAFKRVKNRKKEKVGERLAGVDTMSVEQSRSERKKEARKNHDKWKKEVLSSSIRLPSERLDLSTLGRLESGAEYQETNDMMSALNAMDVNRAKE